MTDQHPITPPPELVQDWAQKAQLLADDDPVVFADELLCNMAARWGADQELEACCEWLEERIGGIYHRVLRAARRPKPPSLKEQALLAIDVAVADGRLSPDVSNVVRRALEALDD